MSIESVIRTRGITEVVHFSPHNGLLGILHSGYVKSRKRLPEDIELEHIYMPNASIRKDQAWLDYVNLSISEINSQFFQTSCRWHRDSDLWWCILGFNPVVLTHPGVHFATTNNMYTSVVREVGEEGIAKLFAQRVELWTGNSRVRSKSLAPHRTTCPQAEALYPQQLSVDFLQAIYVKIDEDQDEVHAQLALTGRTDVKVITDPTRFGAKEA